MTDALWKSATLSDELVRGIMRETQVTYRVARLIALRGVTDSTALAWLQDETQRLHPDAFTQISAAVALAIESMETGGRIGIVGDYDVDGVTSTAILATALRACGADVETMIPHRTLDGYGLTVALVDRVHAAGCTLLITVDNGIRTHAAVDHAKRLGLQVIVTDHHEPEDTLPQADAILHWRLALPETKILCGAGVALLFAQALLTTTNCYEASLWPWLESLATLGTLADMMPLVGENRRLVRRGLRALQSCQRPGWLALCEMARVNPPDITEITLLWHFTPRLNAAGRMAHASHALALLLADDAIEAATLVSQLEGYNTLRKQETERVTTAAMFDCHSAQDGNSAPPAVVAAGVWPLGIVGIVAAKLVDAFGRPAIVFADDGSSLLRGSGRAPEGFPLHEAVAQAAEVLAHFGGHEAAIGCAVERDQLAAFTAAFQESAASLEWTTTEGEAQPTSDDYLPLEDVSLDTCEWLSQLAPFGPENPTPTLTIGPVQVMQIQWLSAGKHAKLRVSEGKQSAEVIWFSAPQQVQSWRAGHVIMAEVCLEVNVWQGKKRPQLRAQAAWRVDGAMERAAFATVFRQLREAQSGFIPDGERATLACTVFEELGFARKIESAYHMIEQAAPRDLRDSLCYQRHLMVAKERNDEL